MTAGVVVCFFVAQAALFAEMLCFSEAALKKLAAQAAPEGRIATSFTAWSRLTK